MYWLAYIEWRSSVDVVVKLLACGAIGPEFDFWFRRYDFKDWLSPASNSRYCRNINQPTLMEYEYTT